jgi:outer membrane protein assembly factor BamB
MNMNRIAILLLAACISAPLLGADWPHWRGPNYDGISTESGWNPKALESPDIAWTAEIGTGFSTISVSDGRAYTMGNINQETDVVYCFDAMTGEERWRHEYPEPLAPKYYEGGTSATPTVHDGKVYTLSKKGAAYCLNADTGGIIWEKALDFKPPEWGFASSVLIVEKMAIYNVGSAGLALNKATGDVIWKSKNDVSGYATPVPYEQDGKACLCIFSQDTVKGVETKTGTVLWSYPWKTKYDVNAADPVVFDEKVFIASGYAHGCALIDISGPKPALVWENKNMRSQMSGPVLIDGYLYGFDDNQLVCMDWKTGEQKWTEKTPQKGSLIAVGDKLIVIGEKGKLFIVQATPQGYQEISSAQVLEHLCWTMPVLANGRIYVRDAKKNVLNNLVCVNVQKKGELAPIAKTSSDGSEWAQWQGPQRDNISVETGLSKKWPSNGPRMRWSAEGIGHGYATVSIADGRIYTTGMKEDAGLLTCIDIDGKQLWQADYGPEWKRSHPGTRCTPTVNDGRVYVVSGTGQVACFNAEDGEKIWLVDVFGQFEGQYPKWGYAESPLVINGKVIVTVGGKKALFAALDEKDGSVVWTTPANGDASAFCSPIAFEWAGKTVIVNMTAGHIMGIDETTGDVLFSYPVSNYITGEIRGTHPNTPIVQDGKIFVSSGYDMGSTQIKLSANGDSVEKVWENLQFDNHHGGIVLIGGKLYGANWQSNTSGKWTCVDWQTGKMMYEQEWGSKGSLTFAEGMLYCYEEKDGNLALVKATPDGFNLISSFQITLGEKEHWAHPVICGKRLYIRHGDVLMAFDIAG